jgi:hypothetical protein
MSILPTNGPMRMAKIQVIIPAAALALALAGCGSSSIGSSSTTSTAPGRAVPVGVSATQLHAIAKSAGHPIYWAGTAAGTYELTSIADGRTYVRYLPPGTPVGSAHPYLTIGTYTRPSPPYNAVRSAGLAKHATLKALKGGGLAVQYRARPTSVYLIFPHAKYEVEVYDPSGATAFRLATTGKVVQIP